MKRYRCIKEVSAGQIVAVGNGYAQLGEENGEEMIRLTDLGNKGIPLPGDYLVRYADGHLSWSPRQAFEDGYVRVMEPA